MDECRFQIGDRVRLKYPDGSWSGASNQRLSPDNLALFDAPVIQVHQVVDLGEEQHRWAVYLRVPGARHNLGGSYWYEERLAPAAPAEAGYL